MKPAQGMERIKNMKGVFVRPPERLPHNMSTGAALIGNGDLLGAVGGPGEELLFWLSKVDFWEARQSAEPRGGARTIGPLALGVPQLKGSSYLLEQAIGEAAVHGRFVKGAAALSFSAWIPRGQNVLVVELKADGQERVVIHPEFRCVGGDRQVSSGHDGDVVWFERRFEAPDLLWPSAVNVAMRERKEISLNPGQGACLVVAVATNHDTRDHRPHAIALARGDGGWVEDARRRHLAWWEGLWRKCAEIEIGNAYLEENYYGSLYVTAACSGNRDFPPGLFGWVTDDKPAWSSDYHANYNFQAPWWGALTANLVELADVYDQPVMDYLPRMKEFARRFLGVRGAYCNVGFGPKGLNVDISNTPYDEGLNFLGQKSNASFLALNMVLRYYLTMDADYARRHAYPFVREVMDFWEDYLVFEEGRYVIPNDCVNEVCFFHMLPDGSREFERAKDKNPPLSLALVRRMSQAAIDMSAALGVDEGRRPKWRHILENISKFPMTERGGKRMFDVSEGGATTLEETNMCCVQHIYPAGCVSLSSDPELLEAGVNTIAYKELWAQGNSFSTIFSAAARVGFNPEMILSKMEEVARQRGMPNFLLDFGGGGIENNSGIPGAINEMLMQSHEGFIRMFPAWPAKRPARFRRLRAVGAFLVSGEFEAGEVKSMEVESERGGDCAVLNPWGSSPARLRRGGGAAETVEGELLSFKTAVGERLRLVRA